MFTCHVHSATRVRDGFGNAGEHRLPACSSRQLAETLFNGGSSRCENVAGKLPATAGWQPALPKLRRANKGIHFFGELFQRGRIGCGSVA